MKGQCPKCLSTRVTSITIKTSTGAVFVTGKCEHCEYKDDWDEFHPLSPEERRILTPTDREENP